MAKIVNNPDGNSDRVQVIYSPEEVLPKNFTPTGDKKSFRFNDIIQHMAWADLNANAPHILQGHKKLQYGNTTFWHGNYVTTFYEALPAVSEMPEAAS